MSEIHVPLPTITDATIGYTVVAILGVLVCSFCWFALTKVGILVFQRAVFTLLVVALATIIVGSIAPPSVIEYLVRGVYDSLAGYYSLGAEWGVAPSTGRLWHVALLLERGFLHSLMTGCFAFAITRNRQTVRTTCLFTALFGVVLFIAGVVLK